jgi:hypothetical protein
MRDHDLWGNAPGNNPPTLLCSIDPVSAVLGGILPALFGGGGNKSAPAPTPTAPPPQAPPQQKPQGKQNTQQPTFMGGIPTPPPSTGQKTLLGT